MARAEFKIEVECHASYKADERPLRFRTNGKCARWHRVRQVLHQWRTPECDYFKIRAEGGQVYTLRHDGRADTWMLDAFRSRH